VLEDRWLTPRPAVLITGATSGLGRYLARQLAGSGWQVPGPTGRDPARVADLNRGAWRRCAGATSLIWPSLGDGARPCGPWSARRLPRLDVLVNNAGIGFGAPGEGAAGQRGRARTAVRRQLSRAGAAHQGCSCPLLDRIGRRPGLSTWARSARSRSTPADAEFEHGYNGVDAYRRSKLALAAFTFGPGRRACGGPGHGELPAPGDPS